MGRLIYRLTEPAATIPDERKIFTNHDLKVLIIPLFLEQLLEVLVGVSDTFMVSYAGEAAVSGVSLVNMFNTVFIYLFSALAAGGAVVVSQYIGSRDEKNGSLSAGQLVMIAAVFSTAVMVLSLALNRQLLRLVVWRSGQGCDGGLRDLSSDFRIFLSRDRGLQCGGSCIQELG